MSADQAKTLATAMAALWQSEFPATVRVLSAVSDAQRDFKPHEKSRSAWDLARHLATSDVWFLDCITNGQFAFDAEKAKAFESSFTSVADLVAFYEKTLPAKLAELSAVARGLDRVRQQSQRSPSRSAVSVLAIDGV